MILISSINNIISNNQDKNPLYLRNLIKEELQNYILNFVYTSQKYNQLIFTGGTCLRKVYGINRLSEDLDFDYLNDFDISQFTDNVKTYFKSKIQYPNIKTSIAGNQNTAFFKFPILKDLNQYSEGTPQDIFVRCDFSKEERGNYTTDKNLINAANFQFFINSYDLSTLFANKFIAFLERSFYKGEQQKIPFKGRDIYDLYWITQLSSKSSYNIVINQDRLLALSKEKDIDKIKNSFLQKLQLIEDKFLYDDLLPLLDSSSIIENFISSYKSYLSKYIDFVL